MSPTSYRAAPPRGDPGKVLAPSSDVKRHMELCRCDVKMSSRTFSVKRSSLGERGADARRRPRARRPTPARYLVFPGISGGLDGEPTDAGGGTGGVLVDADGLVAVDGEADGIVVALLDFWPIRCARVSESRRPVTLMFSAF